MNNVEFDSMMATVQGTYGKTIKSETKEVTWHRVKHIDGRHVKAITDRLCDREKMPENLGKAILDSWACLAPSEQVSEADKDKFSTGCPECDPGPWQGQIAAFKKLSSGKVQKMYFDCPICRPSAQYAASRKQIAAQGFIVPPTQWDVSKYYFRMFAANNGDLVERMGQEFSGLLGSPRRMCEAASEQKRAAA